MKVTSKIAPKQAGKTRGADGALGGGTQRNIVYAMTARSVADITLHYAVDEDIPDQQKHVICKKSEMDQPITGEKFWPLRQYFRTLKRSQHQISTMVGRKPGTRYADIIAGIEKVYPITGIKL